MREFIPIFSWFVTTLFGGLFLAGMGCSSDDDSDTNSVNTSDQTVGNYDHLSNVEEITGLLPPHTRGALSVDFETLFSSSASQVVSELLEGDSLEASLAELFHRIAHHSLKMDIARSMRTAVLAESEDPARSAVLLSRINFDELEDIPGLLPLEPGETYKGHVIHIESSTHLRAVLLPDRLLAIADEAGVKTVIDAYEGDRSADGSSKISPYLADLLKDRPVTGVYGLPAMYKELDAGLTLDSAVALGVWLELSDERASGEVTFYTGKAAAFVKAYNQAAKVHQGAPLTVVEPADGKESGAVVPMNGVPLRKSPTETIASRFELKMLFDLMKAKDSISGISSGETLPWANFFVHDAPPSIFINWEIPQSKVDAFSEEVLPEGFEMAKLRILESDEPAYFLVLNVYTTEGIVSGVRFEWSVFVEDPLSGKPRFMVIEAMADSMSMDPVNLMTTGEPVTHVHEGGVLVSEAQKETGRGEEHYFTSRINWPQAEPIVGRSAREFVTANDFIFWGGGVADLGLYSGSVYNRDVIVIPPGEYEIADQTPWAQYIDAQPRSIYVYQNELDIAVAMWSNLDAPYLDMTEARRNLLKATRNPTTKGMVNADVNEAFAGKDNAFLNAEIENTTPSLYVNYAIDASKVSDFETALGLPAGYHLERTRILEEESEEAFYLTLAVYESKGAVEGTRAEWWAYVDDGNGREHVMIVDLLTEEGALEPVALLNLPAVVEHGLVEGELRTTLLSEKVDFAAKISMEAGVEAMNTLDWAEARELVCYLNGICDKFYVGGGSLEPLLKFDSADFEVQSSTPWTQFVDSQPRSVLVRTNRQVLAKNPWHNVMPN